MPRNDDESSPIPSLETDRLSLRCHRLDDFADSAAMWADADVTRWIGGRPFSEEETWARLLRYVGHWALLGFGYWVVLEKASGRFVGEVGFADWRRDIVPSIQGRPEIAWVLASWARGRGFATEATLAAITWGETHFGPVRTACLIHPGNAPSLRVAEKCGYQEAAWTTYKDHPVILLDRPFASSTRPVFNLE
jgi:RimJ/RimL family protein N-acetyltransferase